MVALFAQSVSIAFALDRVSLLSHCFTSPIGGYTVRTVRVDRFAFVRVSLLSHCFHRGNIVRTVRVDRLGD